MPELTKSSVGSFAGTSELEGTMLWPFERKYSRKLVRISLDFIQPILLHRRKKPGAPRTLRETPALCVDAPVLQEPRAHRSHGALVRRCQLLQRAPCVERREELAILVFGPGLAGLRRHLELPPLEALHRLDGSCSFVQRAHHERPLVGAFRREDFPGFRIDAVRERAHDSQCL